MPSYAFVFLLVFLAVELRAPAPTADSPCLLAGPYLGETTLTSVAISWATDAAGASEVRYDPDYGGVAEAASEEHDGKYWHTAVVVGLEPGATYRYRIYTGGQDLTPWAEAAFSTAPHPGARFSFAILGDGRPGGEMDPPSPGALAVAVEMGQNAFDLAVHTGDIVYHGGVCDGPGSAWEQYIRAYFCLYHDILGYTPFYLSMGNHELGGGVCGRMAYESVFYLPANAPPGDEEEYYGFDWGDVHFIALDTNQDFWPGSEQRDWLESDLTANGQSWTLVFFHHPAYSSGNHGVRAAVVEYLVPLFEAHNIDVVFNGHDHHYERTCPILSGMCAGPGEGGVVYIVTAGAGARLYDASSDWFTEAVTSTHHFMLADVDGCRLRLQAVDTGGAVFDDYEVDRCPVPSPTATATPTATPTATMTPTPGTPPEETHVLYLPLVFTSLWFTLYLPLVVRP